VPASDRDDVTSLVVVVDLFKFFWHDEFFVFFERHFLELFLIFLVEEAIMDNSALIIDIADFVSFGKHCGSTGFFNFFPVLLSTLTTAGESSESIKIYTRSIKWYLYPQLTVGWYIYVTVKNTVKKEDGNEL
jgi:hypothetical protein